MAERLVGNVEVLNDAWRAECAGRIETRWRRPDHGFMAWSTLLVGMVITQFRRPVGVNSATSIRPS